jgi:hypothetical protein
MSRLISLFLLFISIVLTSCSSSDRYQEGYENGYKNGYYYGNTEGQQKGFLQGNEKGYEQGYADGFQKSHKDLIYSDITLADSLKNTLRIFALIFFFINIIVLLYLVGYLLIKERDNVFRIAKVTFILMAIAIAYLTTSAFSVDKILHPDYSQTGKWIIIILIIPASFYLCYLIRKIVLHYSSVYSEVLAIIVITFVLTYYFFFLLNIELFILENQFASLCIISVSSGALAFAGYALIDSRIKELKIKR